MSSLHKPRLSSGSSSRRLPGIQQGLKTKQEKSWPSEDAACRGSPGKCASDTWRCRRGFGLDLVHYAVPMHSPGPEAESATDELQLDLEAALGHHRMQTLDDPHRRLSQSDYSFLRSVSRVREAVAGRLPLAEEARLLPNPDGRAEPPIAGGVDTFSGEVAPAFLEVGTPYYRAVGHGQYPNGACWTKDPIRSEAELRSTYAVRNDWNGDRGVVVFIPRREVPAWVGTVAPQQATNDPSAWLPGGGVQLWIVPGSLGPDDGDWYIGPLSQAPR